MAAVTSLARWLRLDAASWSRYDQVGSLGTAALLTVGAYAIIAFDRFGIQGFTAPRGAVRLILVGLYGWVGLAAGIWAIRRLTSGDASSLQALVRLVGRGHIPMLIIALTIQALSVSLELFGVAFWLAWFSFVFWMPALLVAAVRTAFDSSTRAAAVVIALPYLAWLFSVGRHLQLQVGHLL